MGVTGLYLISILSGLITMNLIFLLATFIAINAIKIRISGSSVIASLFLTWLSVGFVIYLFPKTTPNNWVVGAFMFTLVAIYIVWLTIFQPKSLSQMIKEDLKKKELLRVKMINTEITKNLKALGKDPEFANKRKELLSDLKANQIERREIIRLNKTSIFNSRLFSSLKKKK